MTAASKDRDTQQVEGGARGFPVAAATSFWAGVIAALNSSGYLVNGSTSATLKCVGVTRSRIDNAAGSAGDVVGETKVGVFGPFANSASTDEITLADVGATCYIVDNATVAKTSNSSARSAAGTVWNVTADGVWVDFR